MQGLASFKASFVGLLRVIFLRGSPERVFYTRPRFIWGLLLAMCASAAVGFYFYQDHPVFVILRIFAKLTMFMLTIVFLTRKIARFRLAYMMLVLVLISLLVDTVLLVLAAFWPEAWRLGTGMVLGACAFYGASNTFAWGLRKPLWHGALVAGLYVAAALALEHAFRSLYTTMLG
ncbi:MAG: hypothetical protein AAF513_02570 [Pseudomonadota bacterium]